MKQSRWWGSHGNSFCFFDPLTGLESFILLFHICLHCSLKLAPWSKMAGNLTKKFYICIGTRRCVLCSQDPVSHKQSKLEAMWLLIHFCTLLYKTIVFCRSVTRITAVQRCSGAQTDESSIPFFPWNIFMCYEVWHSGEECKPRSGLFLLMEGVAECGYITHIHIGFAIILLLLLLLLLFGHAVA
jgi:hypothetical protein